MGGGGGFLGTILNIVSIAIPAIRPIALAVNTINAIDSGNPLALASSAMGWGNYSGAFEPLYGADSVDSSGWSSNSFDGSGFQPGISDAGSDIYGFDYDGSIGADNLPRQMDPSGFGNFVRSTDQYGDLSSRIQSGVEGAQAAAGDAIRFTTAAGVAAGSQEIASNTLNDLFSGYDASQLQQGLDLNTIGGYSGARDAVVGLDASINKLSAAAQPLDNLYANYGQTMDFSGDTAALGSNQVNALNTDYNIQDVDPTSMYPKEAPAIDVSGGGDSTFKMPDWGKTNLAGGQGFDPNAAGTGMKGATTYDAPNQNWMGTKDGTGLNFNAEQTPIGQADNGLKFSSGQDFQYKPQGSTMNTLANLFKPQKMDAMQVGMRGAGGLLQDYNNKKAMGQMQSMYDRAMGASDPFANERALASSKWTEGANNPDAAWNRYMQGSGGQALSSAAAKYAKAGRRNMLPQLTSQAKQQFMSDYYPKYMEMFNPNQFKSSAGETASKFAGPLAQLQARDGMGWTSALTNIVDQRRLADLFS